MKINNLQVLNICSILKNKYDETNDTQIKWKIVSISEELFKIKSRFDLEKNNIIEQYGVEDEETKQKTLKIDDEHFQQLLGCESDIPPISLDDLDGISFSLEEMIVLKPIIKK